MRDTRQRGRAVAEAKMNFAEIDHDWLTTERAQTRFHDRRSRPEDHASADFDHIEREAQCVLPRQRDETRQQRMCTQLRPAERRERFTTRERGSRQRGQ